MDSGQHSDLIGTVVRIDGQIYECYAVADDPVAFFRDVGEPCQTCGRRRDRSYVIGSMLYSTEVKPVRTVPST